MKKLRIALDFDDIIAQTSILKTRWIEENVPNWKQLLAKFKAQEFIEIGRISTEEAIKKGEEYASRISSFPPWLTDRINCISIIGKDDYEKMSHQVYGHSTLQVPEIRGVRHGIMEMSKNHELIVLTSRRKEHLKFAEEWLKEKEMHEWFDGIHSMREMSSKIEFCLQDKIDVIIDDEIRSLKGNAPHILKILVAVAEKKHSDSVIRVIENGEAKIVPLVKFINSEDIVYVPKFEPYVREEIDKWQKSSLFERFKPVEEKVPYGTVFGLHLEV